MKNFKEAGKRGNDFIEEIVHAYYGKRILIVSHGALVGLTLRQLLPDRLQSTSIDNTSLTILNTIDGKWDCTLYNCTEHLKTIQ